MWKHRSSLCIMAEILEVAMNGALKTLIMYKANLSFAQLNEYLLHLLEVGLLRNVNNGGKSVYKTSARAPIQSRLQENHSLIRHGRTKQNWLEKISHQREDIAILKLL